MNTPNTGLTEYTPLQESTSGAQTAPTTAPVVTLIRAGTNVSKTVHYTPEFLQRTLSEGHFSGALMRVDHPTRSELSERPEGSLASIAARTGDAYWDPQEQAVKAPLVWVAEDVPGSPAQRMRTVFRDPVLSRKAGLSIAWCGNVEYGDPVSLQDGRKVRTPVRLLPRPGDSMFVDFVTSPAAGGAVPLLASMRPEDAALVSAIVGPIAARLSALEARETAASAPPPPKRESAADALRAAGLLKTPPPPPAAPDGCSAADALRAEGLLPPRTGPIPRERTWPW